MAYYEVKEKDWKLFKKLVPIWQEKYMEKLNKEYIEILSKEGYSSFNFRKLEKRIKEDKRYPGVIIRDLDKSNFYDYTLIFIRDKLITEDDIKDFSDEFKENIKMRRETYGF